MQRFFGGPKKILGSSREITCPCQSISNYYENSIAFCCVWAWSRHLSFASSDIHWSIEKLKKKTLALHPNSDKVDLIFSHIVLKDLLAKTVLKAIGLPFPPLFFAQHINIIFSISTHFWYQRVVVYHKCVLKVFDYLSSRYQIARSIC